MTETNPLVDKGAKTTWQDYNDEYGPLKVDENGNVSPNGIPFITYGPGGTAERPKWGSGIPVTGSVELLLTDLANGDDFNAFFDALAVIADAVGVGVSALGIETWGGLASFIAQPLIAWILDHVAPLRALLDLLVGNPGTVTGVSKTWTNMGEALGTTAKDFNAAVGETTGYWTGTAGDAYRDPYAKELAVHINDLGLLCEIWSALLQVISDLILALHNLVRDIISALLATLISMGIDAMAYPPPVNVGILAKDGAVEVTRAFAFTSKAVVKVAQGVSRGVTIASQVLTEIRRISSAIKYFVDLANRDGDASPAGAD